MSLLYYESILSVRRQENTGVREYKMNDRKKGLTEYIPGSTTEQTPELRLSVLSGRTR